MNSNTKILFISEKSPLCYKAFESIEGYFFESQSIFWDHGDPALPALDWHGEWIISFKSDLLLPKQIINSATKGAINFHPAPPSYRGIGGYVHSLYNQDKVYGVTCHHMNEDIDKGKIIKASYFALNGNETASSLRKKTAEHCFMFFHEIMEYIISEKTLPVSEETWGKKLYTHKSLDKFIKRLKSKNIQHNCLI